MSNTTSLDPRARFWGNLAKVGLLIFTFAIFGPFIWLAVGGLVGFLLFLTVGGVAWALQPAVFTLAASMRLKLMKAAVAVSPVEALQEEHRRRTAVLEERSRGIQAQVAANREFKATIDALQDEFPGDPVLPQMREDYEQLTSAVEEAEMSWKCSFVELEEFERGIDRAKRLWASSLALAKARGLSALSEDEWQARLKTEVAFDTIRQRFDQGIAGASVDRMKLEAAREARKKTLPTSATASIEIPGIRLNQKDKTV